MAMGSVADSHGSKSSYWSLAAFAVSFIVFSSMYVWKRNSTLDSVADAANSGGGRLFALMMNQQGVGVIQCLCTGNNRAVQIFI